MDGEDEGEGIANCLLILLMLFGVCIMLDLGLISCRSSARIELDMFLRRPFCSAPGRRAYMATRAVAQDFGISVDFANDADDDGVFQNVETQVGGMAELQLTITVMRKSKHENKRIALIH